MSAEGLCRLPEPSPGDLFLDLEGARFVREGGQDYLFGLGHIGAKNEFVYYAWWAMDAAEEQRAFETLMDAITEARAADPNLHVYHFAPYVNDRFEAPRRPLRDPPDALDRLLRERRFVDLYAVTRQAVRAGIESYSIKELEQDYGYSRDVPLRDAAMHRIAVEMALEARDSRRDHRRDTPDRRTV